MISISRPSFIGVEEKIFLWGTAGDNSFHFNSANDRLTGKGPNHTERLAGKEEKGGNKR